MRAQSLRTRLIVIILGPLLLISIAAAAWQFRNATNRAEDIFDRGLLSAALAISRDVDLSGGDALSPSTRSLVSDTSGGELFYHVFAPDGVFVTGYSTPPRPPPGIVSEDADQLYFDATYQGRVVRVLRFRDATTVDEVSGLFTITVWQDQRVRTTFVRDVAARAITVIVLLLSSLALVVWFGVGVGLRPLLDLQDAIAKRTPNDLTPIRREVPLEARGIVSTLNLLLERISRRISSKDEFISNAAHQLRNPIAGVLALAESVESAQTPMAAKSRSTELVQAARDTAHLANQLLSFERATGSDTAASGEALDLRTLITDAVDRFQAEADGTRFEVQFQHPQTPVDVWGDDFMLREALLNLFRNSAVHGGPKADRLEIELTKQAGAARLRIADNGVGIPEENRLLALGRFSQANAGPGSGLGLPIAIRVFENHGGHLRIGTGQPGLEILIDLPLTTDRAAAK